MDPSPHMTTGTQKARSYSLRFISGKYQGGEFPLPKNGEIVIGRSSELDMVLVEDMVSRRHAKITVAGEEIYIQDLGSTNGTFVNGEKITRARVQEGDRILIGTSIIKLVSGESPPTVDEPKARLDEIAAAAKRTSQVRTMTGSIAEVPLPDLLQLFGASKKSGTLIVRTDHEVGKVFLDKGRVVYATINDQEGADPLKTMYRILWWEAGAFEMEPGDVPHFDRPITMSTEGLLMEGMRQLDEIRRLGTDLPPLSSPIGIAKPLDAPLTDLTPEELTFLQYVHNSGTVQRLFDERPGSDLEAAEILVRLIQKGYVKAS